VMPCLHKFCYACIMRWAESTPKCPLCKRTVTSILHSVRADNNFAEHVISPPAAASTAVHPTRGDPSRPAAHHLHGPVASQPSAAGPVPRAPVGSIYPHDWARVFRQDPTLLHPLLPQLRQRLQQIFSNNCWEAMQSLVLSSLHLFGLDEESLVQLLQRVLGRQTGSFVRWLIDAVVQQCGREARRRLGLGEARAAEEREGSPAAAPGPAASRGGSPAPGAAPSSSTDRSEAEELPSTSPAALTGGPGSHTSAPTAIVAEAQDPQAEPGEAVPGPSSPGGGRERSPGVPRPAPKRRAGSHGDTAPPDKRPSRRRRKGAGKSRARPAAGAPASPQGDQQSERGH